MPTTRYSDANVSPRTTLYAERQMLKHASPVRVLDKFGNLVSASKLEGIGPMLPPAGGVGATQVIAGRNLPPKAVQASKSGFSMTPTEGGGGLVSRVGEGLSGEPKLAKAVSKKNVPIYNEKIAKDLGLPAGKVLDADNLKAVEAKAWGDYEAIRNVGRIPTDEAYQSALAKLGEQYRSAAKDFPELARADVEKVVKGLSVPEFDSNSAVNMVRQLRESATEAYAARNGGLAKTLRGGAQALEDMIERHLERPQMSGDMSGFVVPTELVDNFKRSRALLAKVHEARKSLAGGTDINPQTYLKTDIKKPGMLTGGGKEVAQFARDFPRSAQKMPVGSVNAPTWSDLLVGGLTGGGHIAAHGLTGGAAIPTALAIAARPMTRSGLASGPYQRWQAYQPQAGVPVPSPEALRLLNMAPYIPSISSRPQEQNR